MEAFLILEDGTIFPGISIGAEKEVIAEIVFNTSMTGYLEVLTDPSYAGQGVAMTYPLIGNYGICSSDMESDRPRLSAFLVRELSRIPSNFRSENTIQNFLKKHGIPGIARLDTRALTKHLREKGTMNGMITTKRYREGEMEELLEKIRAYQIVHAVPENSVREAYLLEAQETYGLWQKNISQGNMNYTADTDLGGDAESNIHTNTNENSTTMKCKPKRVAFLDLGTKRNILRCLTELGMQVNVFPARTRAETILQMHPDGIMISNGPGDPKDNPEIIREIQKLYDSQIPIFAICLGHQLMALATGADTFKLKYGHRGGNHPVKDLETGRVYITSQNHGYAVDPATVDPRIAEEAFVNVNDRTNEGLRYKGKKILTVQFHPEACPGPRDSAYLFRRFLDMMS